MRLPILAALAALAAGCAIQQTVRPVAKLDGREVCVVTNPQARPGFLEQLRAGLADKGYAVRMLPLDAATDSCPVTATYTANWTWDLALYMSYAEIHVYAQGKPAGEAVYDSRLGGANVAKFIDASVKIRERVDRLLPGTQRS